MLFCSEITVNKESYGLSPLCIDTPQVSGVLTLHCQDYNNKNAK